MRTILSSFTFLLALLLFPFRPGYGQESRDVFPQTWKAAGETVRLGVIAEKIGIPGETEIAVDTLGAAPGDPVNPIIGGIRRADENTCLAMVRNRGRNPYSLGYSFVGVEKGGREVFDHFFSAVLKPDEETTQRITGCDEELNLAIVLRSAQKR